MTTREVNNTDPRSLGDIGFRQFGYIETLLKSIGKAGNCSGDIGRDTGTG